MKPRFFPSSATFHVWLAKNHDQPTGYQHTASWWVTSAKRDESRQKRLATLIELSASSRRLPVLTSPYARAKDKTPLR